MFSPEAYALAEGLVSRAYINQGSQATARRSKLVTSLLSERRLPKDGWDDHSIEAFLSEAAMMDSNNFLDNVGVGEREARVYSPLVARRHWNLAHGIGRSGDVAAEQPKAAGSSLLNKLTNLLVADAMKIAGLEDMGPALVLPLATGMTLTLVLLAMKSKRPKTANKVVWCRLDQKTCVKAVLSAGLELVVVSPKLVGDQLCTDVDAVRAAVETAGPSNVCCVITSTSCFAPRSADACSDVAKMCSALDVGHVINNAYGIQAAQLCKEVTRAWRRGRVDAVVQSTDKNFMVPVGGAVVCSGKDNTSVVDAVRKSYPGRASISPVLDLLITLLSMGADGWARCLAERESVYGYMQTKLGECVGEFGERLLETPGNPISMGVSLERHAGLVKDGDVSFFGSMLFSRCVSGTRVVAPGKRADVGGVVFDGFGASHDAYPVPYFTAAAALGTTEADVDRFCAQLKKCFKDFRKKAAKRDGEGGTDKGDEGVDALDAAADQLARVNL